VAFKNALCLAMIPEASNPFNYGLRWVPMRNRFCQRLRGHKGPHRSWSREWNEGEKESRLRGTEAKEKP